MSAEQRSQRYASAAAEFDQHEHRTDGGSIVRALDDGMTHLRNLLFERIHADVEYNFGVDSMFVPVSPMKAKTKTHEEIDIYQIVESSLESQRCGYVSPDDDWYTNWLGDLRFDRCAFSADMRDRILYYKSISDEHRRSAFSNVLERTFREAVKVPLVVYKLFPLAVAITTAAAFRDNQRAADLRHVQEAALPSIADCRQCHGEVLESGEICQECGNPLWNYKWLTAH